MSNKLEMGTFSDTTLTYLLFFAILFGGCQGVQGGIGGISYKIITKNKNYENNNN